jgi:predicted  nucleic acid-binding Zn-ribbon protein
VLARDTRKAEQNMSEERLVKLELNAEHLKNDVADFKITLEKICTRIEKKIDDLAARMDKRIDALDARVEKLRDDMWKTRLELLLIGAGLLAIIARQFGWL